MLLTMSKTTVMTDTVLRKSFLTMLQPTPQSRDARDSNITPQIGRRETSCFSTRSAVRGETESLRQVQGQKGQVVQSEVASNAGIVGSVGSVSGSGSGSDYGSVHVSVTVAVAVRWQWQGSGSSGDGDGDVGMR